MTELDELRGQIDEIDRELADLFLKRMQVTHQVGVYKKSIGMAVLDPKREREVLDKKAELAHNPADKRAIATLFETIMGLSRRDQRTLVTEEGQADYQAIRRNMEAMRAPLDNPRVLFQGQPGAYADEAAGLFFGEDTPRHHVDTWAEIFEKLQDGTADYGVLPIENSSTGAINQVYDLLGQAGLFVVGEQNVAVRHCLAGCPGATLDDIKTVFSHEQGLLQCSDYVNQHGWRGVARSNTAESARFVSEAKDLTQAAICSLRAAARYGLTILAEGINTASQNHTRFVVAASQLEVRSGSDKVSAVCVLPHRPGALHELMTIFAVNGLNLLMLESRPIPDRNWEYRFFVDFSGNLLDEGMDGVLHELAQTAEGFQILGNYPSDKEA